MADRLRLDPGTWERAVEIFERALELPPESREALIAGETATDPALAKAVRGMLAADSSDGDMIDRGLEGVADLAAGSVPDHPLQVGDVIGNFEVIGELGRGGMGIVYAARDKSLGRIAALKLLPARTAHEPVAIERLLAEAQAASGLDHPNVATIYQVGETPDGQRFIAMARYEGETLRQRLTRAPIQPREAFDIARQVAAGLAAAHSAGLVHRDVKPENIFLTKQGLVKLLDFGIATLAGSPRDGPTTRGTILYISPEHARRSPADARSDVWSLGVVLYEMLAGVTPFAAPTAGEVLSRITEPSPVQFPPAIRKLPAAAVSTLARTLEKDPGRRLPDAAQLSSRLDAAVRQWSRPRNIRLALAASVPIIAALSIFATQKDSPPPAVTRQGLAVMPVAGDSSDLEAMNLATALSNEIAARVVALGRVRLVRYGGDTTGLGPPEGLQLLRLSIERNAGGPGVAVSLEDASTQEVRWSERRSFDRNGLRELGRDVVIGILGALGQPVTDRERGLIGNSFPSSAEAYAEFLRASRFLALRTPPALESALVHYRKAGELDSTFAGAFARQSYAYSILLDWGWKPSASFTADPLTEGLALAERATRLDSTSAEAWLARAYILVNRDPRRFTGAVEAFQYSIALDPYNAEAFHQYGQTLTALGRYNEALAAYRRALDLEPDRAMTLVPMAAIHKRLGRTREGLRLLDSAISAAPRVPYALAARSMSRSDLGMPEGALDDAELALSLDAAYRIPPLAAMARALYHLGDTAEANARLEEARNSVVNPAAPTPTEAYWISTATVVTGQTGPAVRLLRNARPRGAWLWFYFQGPELSEFRKLPEVAAVLDDADPRRPVIR